MIPQSKIYLKGEREPITCSEKAALSVQKLFFNNYTPSSRPITIGRYCFTKDASRVSGSRKTGTKPPIK